MKSQRRYFTLIELIVVVVIIMIIVGMTVPAFTRIIHGNAVDHAASMVASMLNLARVEACAKEKLVAVVFADQPSAGAVTYSTENEIYNKRAMRCCYVTTDSSNNLVFDEWVENTAWDLIPLGAIFNFRSGSVCDGRTLTVASSVEDGGINVYGTFSHLVIFDTDGKLLNPSSGTRNNKIRITEGVYADNGDLDSEASQKENAENYLEVEVRHYTGNVITKQR